MTFHITDSFTMLYFLCLLLMVIFTNILPYLDHETAEIQIFNNTKEVELEEELMKGVVANQIIIMIIGISYFNAVTFLIEFG